MLQHRRLPADESGQTFVEWLGAMALIVALVALLIAAVPDIADPIKNAARSLIDSIGL